MFFKTLITFQNLIMNLQNVFPIGKESKISTIVRLYCPILLPFLQIFNCIQVWSGFLMGKQIFDRIKRTLSILLVVSFIACVTATVSTANCCNLKGSFNIGSFNGNCNGNGNHGSFNGNNDGNNNFGSGNGNNNGNNNGNLNECGSLSCGCECPTCGCECSKCGYDCPTCGC